MSEHIDSKKTPQWSDENKNIAITYKYHMKELWNALRYLVGFTEMRKTDEVVRCAYAVAVQAALIMGMDKAIDATARREEVENYLFQLKLKDDDGE